MGRHDECRHGHDQCHDENPGPDDHSRLLLRAESPKKEIESRPMEWAKVLVPAVATLIGAAVIILGWHKSHQLASSRDQENKRRELRLTMMLDAYRALANSAHRPFVGDLAFEAEKALSRFSYWEARSRSNLHRIS